MRIDPSFYLPVWGGAKRANRDKSNDFIIIIITVSNDCDIFGKITFVCNNTYRYIQKIDTLNPIFYLLGFQSSAL